MWTLKKIYKHSYIQLVAKYPYCAEATSISSIVFYGISTYLLLRGTSTCFMPTNCFQVAHSSKTLYN